MRIPASCGLAAGLLVILPAQSPRDLTAFLPEKTALVVDLVDATAVVKRLFALLEPLPRGIPAEARALLMGLPLYTKASTGRDVEDLLDAVAPGQVVFAMYPGWTIFPLLMTRIEDAAEVRRIYRKLKTEIAYDISDGVLTVADTPGNLKVALRFRKSGRATLLASEEYREHRAAGRPGESIRFYVKLDLVQRWTGGKFWKRLPDPAKVLFGPIVKSADLARRVDGRLDITDRGLVLRARLDASIEQDRVARLTATGTKTRSVPPFPRDTMACVSLDRDFGELLRNPGDWLGADAKLDVANFLSSVDLLLSGASFMKDFVPNIELPMNFFVTANEPDQDSEQPLVKFPAFTLVFRIKSKARQVRRILKNALVTITTVSNPNRLAAKLPPLSVRRGSRDGCQYQFVSFGDFEGEGDPPTEQGFSPTLVFAQGYGILASTIDGAMRMVRALKTGERLSMVGDYVALRGKAIAESLRQNLQNLAVSRVLEEGDTLKDARAFISLLAVISESLEFDARVSPMRGATEVEIHLRRSK